MKTYWDYSEQERAEMSSESVQAILSVELMTRGVIEPKAPQLQEVATVPIGDKQTFFGIHGKSKYGHDENLGICFETAEQAAAFIKLKPFKSDYDYEVGYEFRYAISQVDCSIASEQLYTMETINSFRSELKRNRAATESNAKLTEKFKKDCEASEKITDGVWADWHRCREIKAELQSVITTYSEYLKMTSGDVGLALQFLRKVKSQEVINRAHEWFPDSIPTEAPPQCVEAVP